MPSKMELVFDEIGYWSELKLDIVKRYALAYSAILSKQPRLHHVYIDAFAGSGTSISRNTGQYISGSAKNALDVRPPFKEYYFIDIDGAKVAELKKITANRPEAHVLQGDCNQKLLAEVFPRVRYEDYRRGLCLLDPYGLDLKWEVIKTAGEMKSIDMFLNFPIMDMNRNFLRHNTNRVDEADSQRIDEFWGNSSWRNIAYTQVPTLFGTIEKKEGNKTIALAFKKRMEEVAKFKFVPDPIPMRNSKNAILYYLFFASQNKAGETIAKFVFDKYRSWGLK